MRVWIFTALLLIAAMKPSHAAAWQHGTESLIIEDYAIGKVWAVAKPRYRSCPGTGIARCQRQCIKVHSADSLRKTRSKIFAFIFQLPGWALVAPSCFSLQAILAL